MHTTLNPDGPVIHPTAKIGRNAVFGKYTEVDERVRVTDATLGDYSYLLHDCEMIYTVVGKFCAIAPFTRLNPGNHPSWRAGMANFTYRSAAYGFGPNDQEFFNWRMAQKVTVGNDVWLGQDVLVLPNVTIGDGAIVGGGSVVTKDVAPYSIVGGIPARFIKMRFEEDVIESLLRIQWWDWEHYQIKEAMPYFRKKDIRDFCRQFDQDFTKKST